MAMGVVLVLACSGGGSGAQGPTADERLAKIERNVDEIRRDVADIKQMLARLASSLGHSTVDDAARKRIEGNERRVVAMLRSIAIAQRQFRDSAQVDQDSDGKGEFGWLGELAGRQPIRGRGNPTKSPFVAGVLGSKDGRGRATDSGYHYRVYLPTSGERAQPEGVDAATVVARDSDAQELRWCCYAWPESRGASGLRAFYVDQRGVLLTTDASRAPYSGSEREPPVDAALAAKAGTNANIEGELAGEAVGGPARDGNTWSAIPD
jgi:hypothetical protein